MRCCNLEQDVKTAAAGQSSHDTGANARARATTASTIFGIVTTRRRITLRLTVIHALLGRPIAWSRRRAVARLTTPSAALIVGSLWLTVELCWLIGILAVRILGGRICADGVHGTWRWRGARIRRIVGTGVMMDLWWVAGRRAVLAGRRSIRRLVGVVGHDDCEKRQARESEGWR